MNLYEIEELLKTRILAAVGQDLAAIEKALADNLKPYYDLVGRIAGHILFAGGKRLRPLLTVLSARACGSDRPEHIRYSTIFEYLHAATLLHDDLVDGALLRRGKPVAHGVFGNETAVLTGDFMLARSLSLAAETGNPRIIQVIAETMELMSQGEIEQLNNRGRIELTEAEYLEVIRRKTAALMQSACHTGALLAGAHGRDLEALKSYGHHLGMAFQMADDLLDYTADSDHLGKAVGGDLREGKLTLPVIHTLSVADETDRKRMMGMIGNRNLGNGDFKRFVQLLTANGGISYAREKALAHVTGAREALACFGSSPSADMLALIADYALARKK
jgi:octaprenyl-diphosphate synthase